jgi:tetratricopeptide (TPR) repeat protein
LPLLAAAYLGWSALSLAWSPNPALGLLGLVALVLGALWFAGLVVLFGEEPASRPARGAALLGRGRLALLVSFLVAGAALAAVALAQRRGLMRLGLHEVGATIGNPNHLAIALVALLPASLWLHRAAREGMLPWPVGGAGATLFRGIALLWAALLLCGIQATRCQAAWPALFAMGLVALLLWPGWGLGRRLAAVGSLAALAAALALWSIPKSPFLASLGGRSFIAGLGLDVISEAPIGGAGLGGFPARVAWLQGERLALGPGAYSPLLDAHNQALMVAGETGLVGLALGALLAAALLFQLWSRRREPAAHAGLVAWAGLLALSFSETVFRDVGVWLVAVAWLALGRGAAFARDESPATLQTIEGEALGAGRFAGLGAWEAMLARATGKVTSLGRAFALPVALVAAFLAVGQARADHLHAKGLLALGRAGEGADRRVFEEALARYDRALETSLDSAGLHLDRALALRALGRAAEAASAGHAAFLACPGPDKALLCGDLAAEAGDLARAALWTHRAVTLHPGYARARNNLGVVLLRAGQAEAGCAQLRRALALRPFEPSIRGNWKSLCREAQGVGLTTRSRPESRLARGPGGGPGASGARHLGGAAR